MNREYWVNFYKKFKIYFPTDFAKFCLRFIPKEATILDIGCGNGRDSYFFAKKGFEVIGIDYAYRPKSRRNAFFIKIDFKDFIAVYNNQDVVYTRFFIHSISNEEIDVLLKWVKGLFLTEFRSKDDEPTLYKHPRNLIDEKRFLRKLLKLNYDILYYEKGKGLAKFKNEDPIVVRIVAKR